MTEGVERPLRGACICLIVVHGSNRHWRVHMTLLYDLSFSTCLVKDRLYLFNSTYSCIP